MNMPYRKIKATLVLLLIIPSLTFSATLNYTFDFDTPDISDGTYPDFTLNQGTGSVVGGVVKLDGGAVGFRQLFACTGFTGDVTVSAKIKGATFGGWNIGLEFGNRRFTYHPGYSTGAFRIESSAFSKRHDFIGNQNMGYNPSVNVFQTMQIQWLSALNKVNITISDPDGTGSSFSYSWTPDSNFDPTISIGFSPADGGPGYFDDLMITGENVGVIPEPSTFILLSFACGLLLFFKRKK